MIRPASVTRGRDGGKHRARSAHLIGTWCSVPATARGATRTAPLAQRRRRPLPTTDADPSLAAEQPNDPASQPTPRTNRVDSSEIPTVRVDTVPLMSESPAKSVVRRFLEHGSTGDGWNMDVINECFDEAYHSHTWQGDLAHTGARQARFFSALEFVERVDSDLVAEGDLVVHRTRNTFRHVGELFGVAPTQRTVTVDHVEMWRVSNGKIVEHWGGLGAGGQLYRAITT